MQHKISKLLITIIFLNFFTPPTQSMNIGNIPMSENDKKKVEDLSDFFKTIGKLFGVGKKDDDDSESDEKPSVLGELLTKHQDKIEKIGKGFADFGEKIAKDIDNTIEENTKSLNEQITEVDKKIREAQYGNSKEKPYLKIEVKDGYWKYRTEFMESHEVIESYIKSLQEEKERLLASYKVREENLKKLVDNVQNLTFGNMNKLIGGGIDHLYTKGEKEKDRKAETVKYILGIRTAIKNLTSKETLTRGGTFLAATTAAMIAAYYGGKIGFNYLDSKIGMPTLVRESSRLGLKKSIANAVFKKQPTEFNLNNVILEPKTKAVLDAFAMEVKNNYENDLPFSNILFYGLPGTGKTMAAKSASNACGIDYAIMSGADFSQFADGKAVVELHKLFDWAQNSKKGLLVFIDEADSFLRDRRTMANAQTNLLNAFLSRTGTSSKKIIFVFATNYENELDPAVLSRINKKIQFNLPSLEERIKILNLYFEKYIINDKRKILIDKKRIDMSIEIPKEINPEFIVELAKLIDGFSGREIEQLISEFRTCAYNLGNGVLTLEVVNNAIEQKISEHKHDMEIARKQRERFEQNLGFDNK
ncbi:AAA family ATPase [Candidatus Dependentiae bacterium]|nr:AAA family ATPase [Candidatus Dependentiae bacterium]MBU4387221.1 AAA family ATPase [Candidatus Dependentiae bacterium]MCG2756010.1 AAA family ATPase [Candidatus Dependentiae bacterium]